MDLIMLVIARMSPTLEAGGEGGPVHMRCNALAFKAYKFICTCGFLSQVWTPVAGCPFNKKSMCLEDETLQMLKKNYKSKKGGAKELIGCKHHEPKRCSAYGYSNLCSD